MNTALELHDSVLASIERRGADVLVVFFPAYVHRSPGAPGIDPGTGWIHEVHLQFLSGTISGESPLCPMGISDGSLTFKAGGYDNCIPLPCPDNGPATLALTLFTASPLTVSGLQLSLTVVEPGAFLEDFPGL